MRETDQSTTHPAHVQHTRNRSEKSIEVRPSFLAIIPDNWFAFHAMEKAFVFPSSVGRVPVRSSLRALVEILIFLVIKYTKSRSFSRMQFHPSYQAIHKRSVELLRSISSVRWTFLSKKAISTSRWTKTVKFPRDVPRKELSFMRSTGRIVWPTFPSSVGTDPMQHTHTNTHTQTVRK